MLLIIFVGALSSAALFACFELFYSSESNGRFIYHIPLKINSLCYHAWDFLLCRHYLRRFHKMCVSNALLNFLLLCLNQILSGCSTIWQRRTKILILPSLS